MAAQRRHDTADGGVARGEERSAIGEPQRRPAWQVPVTASAVGRRGEAALVHRRGHRLRPPPPAPQLPVGGGGAGERPPRGDGGRRRQRQRRRPRPARRGTMAAGAVEHRCTSADGQKARPRLAATAAATATAVPNPSLGRDGGAVGRAAATVAGRRAHATSRLPASRLPPRGGQHHHRQPSAAGRHRQAQYDCLYCTCTEGSIERQWAQPDWLHTVDMGQSRAI